MHAVAVRAAMAEAAETTTAPFIELGLLLRRQLAVERGQRRQLLLHAAFAQLGHFDHLAQTFRRRQLGEFAACRPHAERPLVPSAIPNT